MCKVIKGDVWTLKVMPTFEGFYFAEVSVYYVRKRTHDVYLREEKAFTKGLELLLAVADDQGVKLESIIAEVGDGSPNASA